MPVRVSDAHATSRAHVTAERDPAFTPNVGVLVETAFGTYIQFPASIKLHSGALCEAKIPPDGQLRGGIHEQNRFAFPGNKSPLKSQEQVSAQSQPTFDN